MSYKILSLKWRPTNFDQIIGQDHITRTLINAISVNRLAQAFLFSGARGVGKTTTARVLASTINNLDDHTKCLDVIELDGASNRGIDEIREIRESVKFAPTMSKYKVYIIDEAHMLTEQAFNALLKTLEEPPDYVIFILATTDPQKMPQTILSRTQRYDFQRISIDLIIRRLKFILNEEVIAFEDSALQLIARKSDGSMRDALSILDQVIAFSDQSVSVSSVRLSIGLLDDQDMYDLLISIQSKGMDEVFKKLNEIIASGVSISNVVNDLSSFLNSCMLIKISNNSQSTTLSKQLVSDILGNIKLSYLDLLKMLNMCLNLSDKIKQTDNPKIMLDVLIVNFCKMFSSNSSTSHSLVKNESDNYNSTTDKVSTEPKAGENETFVSDNQSEKLKTINEAKEKSSTINEVTEKSSFDMYSKIVKEWKLVIKNIDKINSKLSSFLEEATIKDIKEETLHLLLDSGNNFIKKVLDDDSQIIIDMIHEMYGVSLKISVTVLNTNKNQDKDESNKDEAEDLGHPLTDDAIKMFKGKITS